MPVSSATNQRSYSAIRCVKFYLRSNMGDERLFNLSLMDIHRHVQVDLVINIDDFVSRRKQCLDFSSTYSSGGICELSGGFAPWSPYQDFSLEPLVAFSDHLLKQLVPMLFHYSGYVTVY